MTLSEDQLQRLINRAIGHGMLVLFIGLIAGVMLVFSLLEVVTLWPLPAWNVEIPGSTRGWQAAHVGGILNGVMIGCLALLMRHLQMTGKRAQWTAWSLIVTGWANTIFYWAGNLSSNRGLSVTDTPFGPGDLMGALAYLGGGSGMAFTFLAVALIARSAFETSSSLN